MGEDVAAVHARLDGAEGLVLALEAAAHLVLGVKGLDDAQAADGLLDVAQQHAPLVLALERDAFQAFAHTAHDPARDGQQHEHEQRQLPADDNHHHQAGDDHDGVLEQHVERGHDGVLDLGHVTAHARHHVALALVGEEADGQRGDFGVNLVADVTHHTGADGDHVEEAQVAAACLQARHEHQRRGDAGQGRRLAVALDDALHIVVEVIDHHVLQACRAQRHELIVVGVQPEQHLKDGDDQCEREQRQERGQQVEQDVQRDIFLVGRHKPLQQFPKTFHAAKIGIF